MNVAIFIFVILIVMALLLYAVGAAAAAARAAGPEAAAAGADWRPGGGGDPEPRNRLLRGVVMRAAILLALALQLAGCASVVIIQRSVPTLADQWRAATVTIPRDARQPITVKE